jgi:Icc-related predicted phosphoesterase
MRNPILVVVLALSAGSAQAEQHASWAAYMKANRYECPGPLDTLAAPRSMKLAGKRYEHDGYRLVIQEPDADHTVKIGVLSAIKDAAPPTKQNVAAALAWFKKEKVEWVISNGDLALEELDLEDVVDMLGESGLPTLVVLGNSESRGSWARTYKTKEKRFPNLINGTWVRQIVADDVEFWTLSGYHDRRFVKQGAGCLYDQEDVDLMTKELKPAGADPVLLVSHGPPRAKGKGAIDRMFEGKNVGDPMLTSLIEKQKIRFGIFGHILEAGGTAVGRRMANPIAPNTWSSSFYLNAGSISGDPWSMNDGSTSTGMAAIVTLDGKRGRFVFERFAPPQGE